MFNEYRDLLTVAEVCVMLRICPSKAYRMLNTGELIGFRNVREWRVLKSSVIQYISEHINNDVHQ